MRTALVLLCLSLSAPLAAQRDFLTADEVDQLRLTQEPNERLALYMKFAQQRVKQVSQLVSEEKAGRSALIHDLIGEYTEIIDAVDTVADDALKRQFSIAEGMSAVVEEEKKMLASLSKVRESAPKDMARYRFVLDQAIETTRDSLDLSSQDLAARAKQVEAKEVREEKERETMMQPKELEEKRATEKKEAETKRKAPTLYRKGEKKPQ